MNQEVRWSSKELREIRTKLGPDKTTIVLESAYFYFDKFMV